MTLLFFRDKAGLPWLSVRNSYEDEREDLLYLYNSLPNPPKIDGKADYSRIPKLSFENGDWKLELPLHGEIEKGGSREKS